MRRVRRVLGVAGLAAAGFGAFAVLTTAADSTEPPETTAMAAVRANPQAFFDSYCGTCHSERMHTAGLVLEKAALSPIGPNAEVWEKVIAKLHAGEMPPSTTKKQPTPEEVKAMVAYLTSSMDTFAASNVRPGRPVDVMGMKVFMRRGNESFQSVFMAWPSADGKSLTLPGIRIMNDANFVHRQAYPDILLAVADPAPYVKRSNEAGYPVTRVTANNAFLNDPSGNVIEMVIHTTMNAFKNPNLAKK